MITPATHLWHSHTVSGDRWLVLKAEYSRRCAPRLGRELVARNAVLRAQAAEAAEMPAADSHLPHN
ncbi:hypothetical protein [Conyzicola sp.]|uniref:hypothetical protein n=1 Tax=Conyzicola sp. TaxID=1969404 RepID=UPI003988B13C